MGHSSKAGENIFWAMNRNKPGIIKRILNALERFIARIRGKDAYLAVEQRQAAERLRDMLTGELKRAYGTDVKGKAAAESGEGKRHSLAGANSRTADLNSLGGAYQMYQNGVSMDTIRKRTGWWLGKDGKWRYEISDKEMRFNPEGYVDNPQTVGDYVKHDRLFAAYPWIADIPVHMVDVVTGGSPATNGKYSPDGKFIELKKGLTSEKAKYVLSHELQHAIQQAEGFVRGTSPKTGMFYAVNLAYDLVKNNPEFVAESKPQDKMNYLIGYLEAKGGASLGDYAKYYYFQNYGETEARNVSQRLDMTEEERRALPIENNGEVFSYDEVFEKIVDNLKAIGYNKKQIDTILKEGVSYDIEQTDVQTSADEVVKRRRNDREETGRLSDADENGRRPGEIYRTGKIPTAGVSESAEILDSERRNGGLRRGNRGTDSQNGALGAGSEAGKRLKGIEREIQNADLSGSGSESADTQNARRRDNNRATEQSRGTGNEKWLGDEVRRGGNNQGTSETESSGRSVQRVLREGVSYDNKSEDEQESLGQTGEGRKNLAGEAGRLPRQGTQRGERREVYRTGKVQVADSVKKTGQVDSLSDSTIFRRGRTESETGRNGVREAQKRLNEVSKPEKRFSLSSNVEQIIENDSGEFVAESDGNGGTRWSLSTYESSGRETLRQYLDGQVSESGLTEADAKAVLDSMDDIYEICRKYEGEYAPFGAWSRAEVVIDEKGNPVFSVIKPNGEYAMNLDFSLVCKKRRALDAVLNRLIETGAINDFGFGQEEIVRVNEIIREHGFEIACDMCFVDAKRYRQAGVADQFVDLYNSIVKSMAKDGQEIDYFNFANDSSLSHTEGGIDRLSDAELDFSEINEITKPGAKKTVEYRIAQYLKTHPSDRKLLSRGDFMSTAGFDAVKVSKPGILKLYNSKKGTGGPKAAQSDVQYLNDILSSKKFNRNAAYDVGGVRVQSFSDYVPRLVFDYVQMIGDLAAKRLPAHAYTKEPLFAKQFGLTGMKINMSLMPAKGNGKYAGLNADGSYAWARESFPAEEAFRIQADPEYGKNVGTIAVGISDEHIWKMLSDPDIRMVIPYHKSGINPAVAVKLNIGEYTNYTDHQNTRRRDGKQLTKAELKNIPDINRLMHRDGLDAVEASRRYVEWCEDNGYIPKFEKFAYMTDSDGNRVFNENYYKLLEDFTTMVDGEFHPQGDVTATFPGSDSAFGSMADLIKEGLEEDAVTANRLNGEVDGLAEEVRSALGREESGKRFSLTRANDEYMKAVESGNVEEQQRLVDEAAENAGYDSSILLHHGTSKFGFTKIDVAESDDGISFFATDKLDTAASYIPYYENSDAYDGIREIGKRTGKNRKVLTADSSIEDFLKYLKGVYPEEYRDARVITKEERYKFAEWYVSDAVKQAKRLLQYSIPKNVEDLVNMVIESEDNKSQWESIARAYGSFKDIPEITYNGMYFNEASDIWHNLQDRIRLLNIDLTKDLAIVNELPKSKEELLYSYEQFTGGENVGIYGLYAKHEGQLVIRGGGSNWNSIPLGDITEKFNDWWVNEKGHEPADNGFYTRGNTRNIAEFAKFAGYRSVCFVDIYDIGAYGGGHGDLADIYAFFYPESDVKSADPITYDDSGNVIPLTERFDSGNRDIRWSLAGKYDYSKSFADQIDDYKNGLLPVYDTFVVSETPKVWQDIGFNALPVTLNQTHVDYALNGTKDADHEISEADLKKLPEKIKEPIAIIQSQSNPSRAVVFIEMTSKSGKNVVTPVEVDGYGKTNNLRIDSNALASVFGKKNAANQLQTAIDNTVNGKTELFYWDKKRSLALLQGAGLQLPSGLPQDGFVHSIREPGSLVKAKMDDVTNSLQFKRWFGDWKGGKRNVSKVVNRDGSPRVVYHYTDADFEAFDTSKSGSNQGVTHGDGIYVSTNPTEFAYAGKNRLDLYASIKKPFEMQLTKSQAERVYDKYFAPYHDDKYKTYRPHDIEKLQSRSRVFDYLSEAADNGGVRTSDILKELGYDGVHDGSEWVAFDSTQLKSATDNIGTFDKDNPKLKYSLAKSAQSELKALQKENEKLRQDVDDLKQELQLTHGRKLSRDALISSIQKILIDRYGVKLSAKELYPHVTNLYDMFYNNTVDGKRLKKDERVDTMRIIEEMDKIVDAVIENAVGVDDTYVEMKKLLPELRNTKLVVPVDARADAAQSAGFENWAEFRKANFGRVGFANEGLPVDTYYMELSERYPELFPDGITHPGEQAAHIADVVNTIRESGINEYQLYDIEDERIRTSIKNDVMDIIGNAEKLQTFADRAAQKVEDTKLAEAMHYGADIAKLKRLNTEKVAGIKAENRKRLSDMRRKYQDRVESVRERYAEARANRSEKQKQTVLRNKVLRKYTEASTMLDRPTTENHFTEAMRKPLMEFLAAVDITTGKSVAKQGIYDRILRVIEAANNMAAEDGKNGLDIAETDLNVQEKQLIVDSGLLERMSAWVEANKGKKLTELSSAQLFDQIVSNEPPVGYVHLDLLQQPYFAADTVRISYEQHTEKNLRLDSRASVILAVIRLADSAGTSSSNTILSQA